MIAWLEGCKKIDQFLQAVCIVYVYALWIFLRVTTVQTIMTAIAFTVPDLWAVATSRKR
jgi:hypothetical protein